MQTVYFDRLPTLALTNGWDLQRMIRFRVRSPRQKRRSLRNRNKWTGLSNECLQSNLIVVGKRNTQSAKRAN
jgi:hypothetical protein